MLEHQQEKIFVVGLPRTGTTSLCAAMLALGYKTAHTAYIEKAMQQAQVIADTPIFNDYAVLAKNYPQAKFIYLNRQMVHWLPSIRQLLERMMVNLHRTDGGFNPIIKRCYKAVFNPLTPENIAQDDFLKSCYLAHKKHVFQCFSAQPQRLLEIELAEPSSFTRLIEFLNLPAHSVSINGFDKMNIAGKVTAWNQIKHPLKIASTQNGRVDKLWYEL